MSEKVRVIPKLYNEKVKEEFLNTFYDNEDTRLVIRTSLFMNTRVTEEIKGKDLYDFSLEEIGSAINGINGASENTFQVAASRIRTYITWAIENGYRASNDNPLDGVPNTWANSFIKSRKNLFSEQEIDDICDQLINGQDRATIRLIFEGVLGNKIFELANLKKTDINWSHNILVLHEADGEERTIVVSDKCMESIKDAMSQNVYRMYKDMSKGIKELLLVDNDYIIRPVARRTSSYVAPIRKAALYSRIAKIGEVTGYDYLTTKGIQQSGIIKKAKDLFEQDGVLGVKQIRKLSEIFKLSKSKYHNRNRIKEAANRENIHNLYGIDIEKN